jgi:hypothetical protein
VALAAPRSTLAQRNDSTGTSVAVRPTARTRIAAARIVTTAPVIDGRLDEPSWQSAEPLSGFVQRELHEGEAVSERTEVRILSDGQALYVGAWLFDRDPAGIIRGEKVRDVSLDNSDYFAVILDTYLDRQNGFVFATTPAGVEYDGQVAKEGEGGGVQQTGQTRAQAGSMGGFNLNWDASWTVATSVDSLGWYAELRIPFSTLRYAGGGDQRWGLNLARSIRRKGEDAYWSFVPRQFNLYRLSRAGTLDGLRVPARRIATVTPYVLGGAQRDFALDRRARGTHEVGGDAKYGVTPSLTLDLTYNTDFAQVEVDEQRTNLTRFPLFFPEKRPFFLENAGVFSAGTPQAVELFFSRRIGIDSAGKPAPILGGGRLTGRVAGLTLGLLEIVTDTAKGAGAQPGNSYSVLRAVRELSTRSRIGAIAVQRLATSNARDRNGTYGADGRVGIGDAWTFDWWGAKTATPSTSPRSRGRDDAGYSVRAGYQTANWLNGLRIVQVGRDFDPQVGFLDRRGGYRFYEVAAQRFVRKPEWRWLKDWNPHGNFRGYYNLDGSYSSGRIHIDVTELETADGGRFGPELNVYHELLEAPFEIADGVTLPVGPYNFSTLGLDWTSDPSAPVSTVVRGDFGPFYNGTRNGGSVTLTMRHGATLTSSLLVDYNDVHLTQGNFVRRLIGTRVAYFFTPRVFVQSLVQYNNQARVWTANARFAWLNTAGTGLFVVLNDGEAADGYFRWRAPQTRSLIVKYTRQIGS